ncbi:dihydroneopterin aldolase [Asticcacaulis solisilvae]|uniref:dihydroneopterin aldolase n=1 Tax=Asticcacaulis solisilvae TaxID=1217274 RepID=UPI003FD72E18
MLTGDYTAAVLETIEVHVRCGLHAFEYERPNRLWVSVWQYGRLKPGEFIDYDLMRNAVVAWETQDHVELLETLLEDVMATAFSNPLVLACRARILKPDIFPDTHGAGVEMARFRPGFAA